MQPEMLGRYRLLRRLAQGGMAEIFAARQIGPEGFERPAVIKRVLPTMASDAEFMKMFLDEARISASLSHPNIVQILDFGQADGSYFLAMEHLLGENLRSVETRAHEIGQSVPAPIAAIIIGAVC